MAIMNSIGNKRIDCLEQYIFLIRDTQYKIQDLFPELSRIFSLCSLPTACIGSLPNKISKCKFNKIQPFTRKTNHQIHIKAKTSKICLFPAHTLSSVWTFLNPTKMNYFYFSEGINTIAIKLLRR